MQQTAIKPDKNGCSIYRFPLLIVGLLCQHNIIFVALVDWFQRLLKSEFGDSIKENASSKC